MKAYLVVAIIILLAIMIGVSLQPSSAQGCTVYDNFQGPLYAFDTGGTSPDGKWFSKYRGQGNSGTTLDEFGNQVLFLEPKAALLADDTHAALMLSTKEYEDVNIFLKVKTERQLRQNSPQNPWEVAWVMWRYQSDWHHYYFLLKPTGIELGKKQNDERLDVQIFLHTAEEPKLALGEWSTWNIRMIDNHIQVWLNTGEGFEKVADYFDPNPINGPGNVGLYTEDALVHFDDVFLTAFLCQPPIDS